MKKIFSFIIVTLFSLFAFTVIVVFLYKFINPPITPHMVQKLVTGSGLQKDWVSYRRINPNFFKAVIAAEDGRFAEHYGVDWKAVEEAKQYNLRHAARGRNKKRGASTISMQTAKNVFLPFSRNYIRKAAEVYFTYMIEFFWGKRRVLEVYANVVEFGEGIYGVEAAARHFFRKPASELSRHEASLLVAVLPNPIRWNPSRPTAYIQRRAGTIRARMNSVSLKDFE